LRWKNRADTVKIELEPNGHRFRRARDGKRLALSNPEWNRLWTVH